MANLKRPDGLIIRRGRWNKLCVDCKRKIVQDSIIKNVELILCNYCKDIFTGKRCKGPLGCRPYKIRPICRRCGKRFDALNSGRLYCYECRPNGVGDKNQALLFQG